MQTDLFIPYLYITESRVYQNALYVSSVLTSDGVLYFDSTLKSQGRITIKDNNSIFIVSVTTHRLNITAISHPLFVYLRIRLFFVFTTNPQFRLIRV